MNVHTWGWIDKCCSGVPKCHKFASLLNFYFNVRKYRKKIADFVSSSLTAFIHCILLLHPILILLPLLFFCFLFFYIQILKKNILLNALYNVFKSHIFGLLCLRQNYYDVIAGGKKYRWTYRTKYTAFGLCGALIVFKDIYFILLYVF